MPAIVIAAGCSSAAAPATVARVIARAEVVAYSAAMYPARSLRNALLCLAAITALSGCGGDDDDSGNPAASGTMQNGSGGLAAPGSGGDGDSGSGGSSGTGFGGRAAQHQRRVLFADAESRHPPLQPPGAMGCPCKPGDPEQCVSGVGLRCNGSHWFTVEQGLCRPTGPATTPIYSTSECESTGAAVVFNPGDGSLFRNGCPDGKRLLGVIDNSKDPDAGIPGEGALCCACARQGEGCDAMPVACGRTAGSCSDGRRVLRAHARPRCATQRPSRTTKRTRGLGLHRPRPKGVRLRRQDL